jgi:hypothetical protein
MNTRRYLLRSINVLNLLVLTAAIGFFIYFLNPLLGTPMSVKIPPSKEMSSGLPVMTGETRKPPIADYALIGEQNLFHPDRIIPEGKEGKKPPASVPRPELVLHGTMMTSELKIAYIEDKKSAPKTPGRSAPYIVAKEGDNVSGYILKQITEKMIMLANGEEQMILYLDELKVRKGEITGPTKAPPQPTIAPPQGPQRPPMPQPAQRPSVVQPVPSAPSSPSRQSASQPAPPMAPPGQPRQPAMQNFPPAPLTPMPSPSVIRRP